MQIRASAFEGESVSVTDLLADSLALTGLATLDGLTAQGNVGCDQLLCNDVNCTDVFTTGVDASGAVSCAALTATGTVAGATLTSTGAVSGGPAELRRRNHGHHQQHGAGNFTTVGDVSTGTLTASGAATAASFAATGALADNHRCGLRGPAGLREPGLHLHGHERRSVDGLRLHQRLVVDHDELALVRPAVPLQEDTRALVAQQPQLRPAVGAALLLDTYSLLQPAQFFVRKRSSKKSDVLVTVSVLEAKSCGGDRARARHVAAHHAAGTPAAS